MTSESETLDISALKAENNVSQSNVSPKPTKTSGSDTSDASVASIGDQTSDNNDVDIEEEIEIEDIINDESKSSQNLNHDDIEDKRNHSDTQSKPQKNENDTIRQKAR